MKSTCLNCIEEPIISIFYFNCLHKLRCIHCLNFNRYWYFFSWKNLLSIVCSIIFSLFVFYQRILKLANTNITHVAFKLNLVYTLTTLGALLGMTLVVINSKWFIKYIKSMSIMFEKYSIENNICIISESALFLNKICKISKDVVI